MRTLFGNKIVKIGRTSDTATAAIQDVRIHHRRPNVTVAKEFLDRTYIVSVLDQVGREGVAECVGGDALGNIGASGGAANCLGDRRFVRVMPPNAAPGILAETADREDIPSGDW